MEDATFSSTTARRPPPSPVSLPSCNLQRSHKGRRLATGCFCRRPIVSSLWQQRAKLNTSSSLRARWLRRRQQQRELSAGLLESQCLCFLQFSNRPKFTICLVVYSTKFGSTSSLLHPHSPLLFADGLDSHIALMEIIVIVLKHVTL